MLYQLSYVRAPPILAISTRFQLSPARGPEFKSRHAERKDEPRKRGALWSIYTATMFRLQRVE
jgi:hypothetical protein